MKRRIFFKNSILAGAAGLASADAFGANAVKVPSDAVILFQGDSITDGHRHKDILTPNDPRGLGNGYVSLLAADLLRKYPARGFKIFNRGISGNKVFQLAERWKEDCIDLKPTVLSILIGVNDFWHTKNGNYSGTLDKYRNDYINLLEQTRNELPEIKLIIAEPFAVPGIRAVDHTWYPAFDEYRFVAKEMAGIFKATFIPCQKLFDRAAKKAPGVYWTHDGVHPTHAGSRLMADAWGKALG
ncbi:MAG: SGNH/GDSL hydrolase family protein [Cyclobacteriaceae bacterium]|nr:SGNH/GDSL hydrolase family protein [Cyclobacteriaceae bacterium]